MSKKLLQVEHLSIALKNPFRPIRKRKNDDLPGNFGAA